MGEPNLARFCSFLSLPFLPVKEASVPCSSVAHENETGGKWLLSVEIFLSLCCESCSATHLLDVRFGKYIFTELTGGVNGSKLLAAGFFQPLISAWFDRVAAFDTAG